MKKHGKRKWDPEPDDDRRQRPLTKDGVRQHEEALTPERGRGAQAQTRGRGRVRLDRHPRAGARATWSSLQELFGLHELAVEDASQAHQRPKIEDYDEDVFVVLKTAHYHEDREEVHFGEISRLRRARAT